MMIKPIEDLLKELNCLQIELWKEGDRLRYKAPKQSLSPELLQQLRDRKAEILAALSEDKVPLQDTSIATHPVEKTFPLSFAQQRLWFLDRLEPNRATYNIFGARKLTGTLDHVALERSLQDIAQRHESLRTNFGTENGEPYQIISPETHFTLPVILLDGLPEESREQEVQRLVQEAAQQPFNLETEPLWRAQLLRLSETEHVLLLTIHHIISDGWSMGIFWRELCLLYTAFSTGQPSPLSPLPIQYADFAVWQRNYLQGEVLATQLQYWQQQLAGELPVLNLPTDFPRPPVQTYRGAHQSLTLSQELTNNLKTLSQQQSVTLFMTLLAAFYILLSRYSGEYDIIIGAPVAGRNRVEIEKLIGFFVNTLALRINLEGNPSFQELLNRVKQVTLEGYAHQEIPFEKLVEVLRPERDSSRTPIFQAWFNMLNLGEKQLRLPGLEMESMSSSQGESKFDITLYLRETQDGIRLKLVYNIDLFKRETIEWMLHHYQTLLEGIVAHPSRPISKLSLFSETERQRLAKSRNITSPTNEFTEWSKQDIHQSIPAKFEEQVQKYPTHIAIKTNHHKWTYTKLNQQGNLIAQAILKNSAQSEQRIALLFEHDAPMIAGILGVLKAGKTYVPLDPDYPRERVIYILEDTQATAIITNTNNWSDARELARGTIPVINVDEIDLSEDISNIIVDIPPDTLAYILYTSGSTGQPKGVIQTHRNLLYFIRNHTNSLHINERDKLTLLSSYSFDAAIVDIWGALLNGATLYPINIKEEGLTNLSQWLKDEEITIYHSTPTLYRFFISSLSGSQQFPHIRLVVMGGEEVVKKDIDLFKEYFWKDSIFVNGFGSTESTFTMQYFINQDTEITRHSVPIGYSVEETDILLLNEGGEPTELYGEIAICSPYIALGYWQKPELTQAVFLPDIGNQRIYRTGDMGRLREDGSIEFLGRKDFQVKIRGFRIELGEIESVLAHHPQVEKVVVIARDDQPGEKYLVAYIVPTQHQVPTPDELRQFLKQKLPNYMIPAAFVPLDALPLTVNGKVDRLVLPAPDWEQPSHILEVPRNAVEQEIALIWAEVLPLKQFGIHHNFFELGGHSLTALQVIVRVRDRLQVPLTPTHLFRHPTIAELAGAIGSLKPENLQRETPKISTRRREAKRIQLD